MDPPQQQQQQQQQNDQLDVGGNKSSSSSSNYLCRQSSSRWTPTSDQIRILKELYYNNGVRSPSAEQIQRISARLRQYGKIEGKNVFYWFQNHKARERQKKRFTCPPTNPPPISDHITLQMQMQRGGGLLVNGRSNWRSHEEHIYNNKSLSITPGVTSSSSTPGVLGVGHMGSYGYGSVTMEKSFRDCSISAVGSHNIWVGADHNPNPNPNPNLNPYSSSPHNLFDQYRKSVIFMEDHDQDDEEGDDQEEDQYQEQQEAVPPELETLPLFPLHGDNIISSTGGCFKPDSDSCYATTWHHYSGDSNMACSRSSASLELSLNSYTGHS